MSEPAVFEDDDTPQCYCCQAVLPVEELEDFTDSFPHAPRTSDNKLILCKLCSSTFAGNSLMHPEQYRESGKVLQAICFVGNKILQEIRKLPQ